MASELSSGEYDAIYLTILLGTTIMLFKGVYDAGQVIGYHLWGCLDGE